jgi:hypothetical protein
VGGCSHLPRLVLQPDIKPEFDRARFTSTWYIYAMRVSAWRIGIVVGAGVGAGWMVISEQDVLSDSFAWFLVALSTAAGAYLCGELVIALARVRRSPLALLKAIVFLTVVSMLALLPTTADAVRAHWFLAHADSARGVVTQTIYRGGKHIWVGYRVGDSSRVAEDIARDDTYQLETGDTARVYWEAKAPARATIGRPAADWGSAFRWLVPVLLIGGVLFLAFDVAATRSTVPEAWQRPLHLLRAYLGAAAMADVGVALILLSKSDLADPRLQLAQGMWPTLIFGAVFCLFFTVVLGTVGLVFLLDRGLRSAAAFALCGVLLGAGGGLLFGPVSLLYGAVSGLFAGLAFRWLYVRDGLPLDRVAVADSP